MGDPALVVHAVAASLGLHEQSAQPLLEVLVGYLTERRLLLILDNCEHLLDACAALALRLLQSCPDVRIPGNPRMTDNIRMGKEVFEAVRTLLAVRDYEDKEVPKEVVDRILEAAHLTASASNRQPWHFVVVRDRANLQALGGLVKTGPYIAQSALAVVVAYEKENRLGVSDVSRAIQSMMLTAWADGVGSNWTGFGGLDGVRQQVELPDRYEVLAVIPFGYPKRRIGLGKKNRKPLSQVASLERFGKPIA